MAKSLTSSASAWVCREPLAALSLSWVGLLTIAAGAGLARLAVHAAPYQVIHSLRGLPSVIAHGIGLFLLALPLQLVISRGAIWLYEAAARPWQRGLVATLATVPWLLSDVVVGLLLILAVAPAGWLNAIRALVDDSVWPGSSLTTPPWPWLSAKSWYLVLLALAEAWRGWPVFWLLGLGSRQPRDCGWHRRGSSWQPGDRGWPTQGGSWQPGDYSRQPSMQEAAATWAYPSSSVRRWYGQRWYGQGVLGSTGVAAFLTAVALRLIETFQFFIVAVLWLGPGLLPTWGERIGTYARRLDTLGVAAVWTWLLLLAGLPAVAWLLHGLPRPGISARVSTNTSASASASASTSPSTGGSACTALGTGVSTNTDTHPSGSTSLITDTRANVNTSASASTCTNPDWSLLPTPRSGGGV